ncbi:hypothetical protein MSAS_38100 [Mycobacterium saskatchewanense]|uniref:DUF4129 domain-containing protein n=1 Tax=Mycobacterium saskatchewanense TaxID=220927 RepID=A0AAJ3NM19_9MYCO|nr:hypothetical protein [Mycobacterium saskatchewanense]ORW67507.1 hypothetical protein AWC23_22655 [Mycobacterium saskatchewanense]BBX64636.1 hypothetical protein MSAS_38100 [Mycobacterium saskatchewanense]
MPGELLRYLGGPTGFSGWWWLVAALCAAALVGYYGGVYVWTLPAAQLRRVPVLRVLHARLLRRRFARTIATIAGRYRAGQLSGGQAAAAMSRTLRSFLHLSTGARVQYMHIGDITDNPQLAAAAPVFAALNDARFSTERADIDRVALATTEVIRTWT